MDWTCPSHGTQPLTVPWSPSRVGMQIEGVCIAQKEAITLAVKGLWDAVDNDLPVRDVSRPPIGLASVSDQVLEFCGCICRAS